MTNATVSTITQTRNGREMSVRASGEMKSVSLPPDTSVARLAPATAALLKPGVKVFVTGRKTADGHWAAGTVMMGAAGFAPPI
jgi:hypothetical protein